MKRSNLIPVFDEPVSVRSVIASLFSVPAACFLVTAIYTLMFYHPLFYFDHWDLVPMIEALDEGRLQAEQVFALHGRHWHASGYIIMLAVGAVTGHAHIADILVNLLLSGIAFLGVVRLMKRQIGAVLIDEKTGIPIAIAALFIFSLDQSQNWLWGWQTAVFVHLVGVVWCVERLTRDEVSVWDAVIAAAFAGLAIYGFGTGWALLPIGFAVLAERKRTLVGETWQNLAVWTGFSALILWHMSLATRAQDIAQTGLATSPGSDGSIFALLLYSMNYVANAVTRFSPDIALPIFLLSAGLALWCLFELVRSSSVSLLKLAPALSLMAYAIGAGLLTALGRLDAFGSDSAVLGRYITFANLFWLGLISLIFAVRAMSSEKMRFRLAGFIALLCVMKLGTIGNVLSSATPHALEVRASAAKIRACYPDVQHSDLEQVFAPVQMPRAADALAYLHDNELSAFAGPADPDIRCGQAVLNDTGP